MSQQAKDEARTPKQDKAKDQGPKTRAKNREMTKTGSPDQGTQ